MTQMTFQPIAALDEAQTEAISFHLRGYNRAHNAAFYQGAICRKTRSGRSIFSPTTPRA